MKEIYYKRHPGDPYIHKRKGLNIIIHNIPPDWL